MYRLYFTKLLLYLCVGNPTSYCCSTTILQLTALLIETGAPSISCESCEHEQNGISAKKSKLMVFCCAQHYKFNFTIIISSRRAGIPEVADGGVSFALIHYLICDHLLLPGIGNCHGLQTLSRLYAFQRHYHSGLN